MNKSRKIRIKHDGQSVDSNDAEITDVETGDPIHAAKVQLTLETNKYTSCVLDVCESQVDVIIDTVRATELLNDFVDYASEQIVDGVRLNNIKRVFMSLIGIGQQEDKDITKNDS